MSNRKQSASNTADKWVRLLFPMRGVATAAAILLVIGTVGFLSTEYLKRSTRLMIEDTLAGLCDASLANASLVETFNKTLLMVLAESDAERERYRREFMDYNAQVNVSVEAYAASIFADDDRANFNHLMECRRSFLAVQQQITALADSGKYAEAQSLFKTSLMPSYDKYKLAMEKMVKYNSDKGRVRGDLILQICGFTQFLIAGSGIGLFVVGFFLGFFK